MSTQEREELLQRLLQAIQSPTSGVSNEEIRKILALAQAGISEENKELESGTSEDAAGCSTDDNINAAQEQVTTSVGFSGIKTYPRRPGSTDSGREYEIKLTALFAIRCAVMKNTQEMWIGSNVDQVGDFDDIMLFKQTSDNEHFAYMIQTKHQEKPKNITEHDLKYSPKIETGKREKSKNDFSLAKYSKSFVNLMGLINNTSYDSDDTIFSIFRYLRRAKRVIFVLFTNKGINEYHFLNNVQDDLLSFLNTSNDQRSIYTFMHAELDYNYEFLQQLVLFTNQAHLHQTEKLIKDEINRFLTSSGVTSVDLKKVTKKCVNFIRTWAKGFEDENGTTIYYTLTKSDIINKLIDIILDPYKVNFSKELYSFCDKPESRFWNKLVTDKTITVVDLDVLTCGFLKSCIGTEIQGYLNQPKRTWLDHLPKKSQNLVCQNFPDINTRIITNRKDVTLFNIYEVLWFNNKVPLLLKIDKVQDYLLIDKILKLSYNNFHVVVTKDKILDLVKIKKSNHFCTLKDLNDDDRNIILNQPVQLQKRCSEILKHLLDESSYKYVKCKDIIQILAKEFSVGFGYNQSSFLIQRNLSKVFLERQVLNKIKDELFVIENFSEVDRNFNNVVTSKQNIKKSEKRPVHHLVAYNEYFLEWIESSGSTNNSRKYQQQHLYKIKYTRNEKMNYSFSIENLWVPLERTMNNSKVWNTTTIISANAGTGKSILMDLVASKTPLDMWVLKVNLNEHEEYYKKLTNCRASDHLKNLFEEILKLRYCENDNLVRAVFKKFLDKKKILILLDGFDEISITYSDEVTKLAKCFHDEGYQMWITTRPVMKLHLERVFNTFSIGLKPFTPSDQEEYLEKYFIAVSKDDNIGILKHFVKELLQAAKVNLFDYDCKFTGIPLQTHLLAEIFANEYINSHKAGIVSFNKKFDLLYLYEEFIKRKIAILCDKFGKDAERTRVLFQEHQQMFSLITVFNKKYLVDLNIEKKLDKYCQDKKHEMEMQFLQREGVVVLDQTSSGLKFKFNVNFVHKTFAEFLAGKWLADNFNNEDEKVKTTIKLLVSCRFKLFDCSRFIFIIMDRILVNGCTSHLAVLNGRLEQINPTDVNTKDKSGRTLLQLMALNGYYHPGSHYEEMEKVVDKMADIIEKVPVNEITDVKDDILGYNVLDYALASDSLAVANKICEKATDLPLNIDISLVKKHRYFTYCIVLEYQALLKVLLLYFASRDILKWNRSKHIIIESYCRLVEEKYKNKNFYNYIDGFGVETLSELFKFKFKDPTSPFGNYYYDLRFAAIFGSINNINLLLSQGFDVNLQDVDFNTPLHYAAIRGRSEVVKILLAEGANVNKAGNDGNTVLHLAAKIGDIEFVEELLIHGAEINKCNINNNTPLHFAIKNGHFDTFKFLVLNGANSNIESKTGDTLLHYAARQDSEEAIIDISALTPEAVNKQNKFGSTPLHVAIDNEQFNAIRILLDNGADCNLQDTSGNSVLHCAATCGDDYILKEVLDKSMFDLQNNKGETALHLASSRYLDATKLLVSKGASCNIKDQTGSSPLHHAINKGNIDIVLELLNGGAEVNSVDLHNSTPLHISTMLHNADISKLLLSNGANVNNEDINYVTPLHYASLAGLNDIVSDILSNGADINAVTLHKYSPLHHALTCGHQETAKLLLSKGANYNTATTQGHTPLHAAASTSCNDIVAQLLTNGLDVNTQTTDDGNTSLHFAAMKGHPETVKLLLDNSASANIQNSFRKTPLHVSVTKIKYYDDKIYERQKATVRLLLDNRANVNTKDEDGNTALHCVCTAKSDLQLSIEDTESIFNYFYTDVVDMLLDKNADVNLKNDEGVTPLDLAAQVGIANLVKILGENNMKADN